MKLARERGEASIPVTGRRDPRPRSYGHSRRLTRSERSRPRTVTCSIGSWGRSPADGAVEELLASVARSAGLPAGGTTAGLVDADEVPDRGDDSDQRASAGQLWALGRHRLLCGDSADPATLRRLLGDERVQMAFLDAPYGVDYRPQRSGRRTPRRRAAAERRSRRRGL